jgi:hypothetical protein
MNAWQKFPLEQKNFEADWSSLVGENNIVGAVTVTTNGSAGLTATIVDTTDNVSIIRVSGGTERTRGNIIFTVITDAPETFTPVKSIEILSVNDPQWL